MSVFAGAETALKIDIDFTIVGTLLSICTKEYKKVLSVSAWLHRLNSDWADWCRLVASCQLWCLDAIQILNQSIDLFIMCTRRELQCSGCPACHSCTVHWVHAGHIVSEIVHQCEYIILKMLFRFSDTGFQADLLDPSAVDWSQASFMVLKVEDELAFEVLGIIGVGFLPVGHLIQLLDHQRTCSTYAINAWTTIIYHNLGGSIPSISTSSNDQWGSNHICSMSTHFDRQHHWSPKLSRSSIFIPSSIRCNSKNG